MVQNFLREKYSPRKVNSAEPNMFVPGTYEIFDSSASPPAAARHVPGRAGAILMRV